MHRAARVASKCATCSAHAILPRAWYAATARPTRHLQRAHPSAILPLIEERARLLPLREIDLHRHPMLAHDQAIRRRRAKNRLDFPPVSAR